MNVKEFIKHYGLTGPQACVLLGYSTPQHLQRAKDKHSDKSTSFFKNPRLRLIIKFNNYLLDFYQCKKLMSLIEKEKEMSLAELVEKYQISDVAGTKLFSYSCLNSFKRAKAQKDNTHSSLILLIKLVNILFKEGLGLREIFNIIKS